MREVSDKADSIVARLAVIESKLETLIDEVSAIREYVPVTMIEHAERIVVLERNLRTAQWLAGVFAVTLIGTFVAHVLGR